MVEKDHDGALSAWNVVDYLGTEEAIEHFLEAAFEDGDQSLIAHAIEAVARVKGRSDLIQDRPAGHDMTASLQALRVLGYGVKIERISSLAAE
jgi:probable addiction module antidote protein